MYCFLVIATSILIRFVADFCNKLRKKNIPQFVIRQIENNDDRLDFVSGEFRLPGQFTIKR
jgi:hypothetical protein